MDTTKSEMVWWAALLTPEMKDQLLIQDRPKELKSAAFNK